MNYEKLENDGFLREFKIELGSILLDLQKKIYSLTKDRIVDHNNSLSIEKKLILPFKKIPEKEFWSFFMNEINNSNELKNLISSKEIINVFKKIFKNPIKFDICTFRARFPGQKRVIYHWHQDEGTWYVSKRKDLINKLTATLWFSINGANEGNSIQLVKHSHKKKLLNHSFVKGQGYFNAEINQEPNQNLVYTVNTNVSEGVIFHPLTLHRSVVDNSDNQNMSPRYSIDIRYYDKDVNLNYKTSLLFKLKKYYKNKLWN